MQYLEKILTKVLLTIQFLVWMDQNLQYLSSAKRLNSCQAWWELFFTRFYFSLSDHPGSRNVKPDKISKQFAADEEQEGDPEPILPQPCMVASLTLDMKERVCVQQFTRNRSVGVGPRPASTGQQEAGPAQPTT